MVRIIVTKKKKEDKILKKQQKKSKPKKKKKPTFAKAQIVLLGASEEGKKWASYLLTLTHHPLISKPRCS